MSKRRNKLVTTIVCDDNHVLLGYADQKLAASSDGLSEENLSASSKCENVELNHCSSMISTNTTETLLAEDSAAAVSMVDAARPENGNSSSNSVMDRNECEDSSVIMVRTNSSADTTTTAIVRNSSGVTPPADPASSSCDSPSSCCYNRVIALSLISVASLAVILCLYFTLKPFYYNLRPNMRTTPLHPEMTTESRCFKMCEPEDLFSRDDKLMKPIVIHDGIKATRYFLYLFPSEPKFKYEEVGDPAYLTSFIRQGKIKEGRERAKVKGLQWPELESYAGFFTINEHFGSHLYFWFFPSQSDPNVDPVILWLQGGPGATSLFGLFKENGPIRAYLDKSKKPQAELNRYSWNRNASVLYIDNPVGTGFSYTSDPMGYPNFVNESSDDLFIALQQFFTLWYDYKDRDFYIFGESYGGKYIPALTHRIEMAKREPDKYGGPVDINLVGIGIGNGWMSPADQGKYASYLFYHGLLDGEQYMTLLRLEDDLIAKIEDGRWFDSWMASDNQLHFILQSLNYSSLYDLTQGQYKPDTMNFWYYMQQPHIRKAMNLGNRSMSDGLEIYKAMIEDTMQSIKMELVEALEKYKVLIYHGSLDIICHFPGCQEMLAKTNWSEKDAFHLSERRAVWFYNEETTEPELAGYVKGSGRLKFMLLRNAGHCAPMDQPQWALRMVEAFINNTL